MKRLFLYFLILTTSLRANDPWSKQNILLETAYQITLYIDWKQTSAFHKYTLDKFGPKTDAYGHYYTYPPNMYMISEINPLLPKYPKQRTINAVCIGAAIGHVIITDCISSKNRIYWQSITTTAEILVIYNNYSIGVRIQW